LANAFVRLHTLDAYIKDYVCQKNIQTRDELVTRAIDVAALTRKSHKRVAVNVLFPNEVASAKPMIGSHLEMHLPKQLRSVAK
jgi:Arc/MetJ family transcription regulator